jgi:hypothetical protein
MVLDPWFFYFKNKPSNFQSYKLFVKKTAVLCEEPPLLSQLLLFQVSAAYGAKGRTNGAPQLPMFLFCTVFFSELCNIIRVKRLAKCLYAEVRIMRPAARTKTFIDSDRYAALTVYTLMGIDPNCLFHFSSGICEYIIIY